MPQIQGSTCLLTCLEKATTANPHHDWKVIASSSAAPGVFHGSLTSTVSTTWAASSTQHCWYMGPTKRQMTKPGPAATGSSLTQQHLRWLGLSHRQQEAISPDLAEVPAYLLQLCHKACILLE